MISFRLLLVFLFLKTAAIRLFRKKLYQTCVAGIITCKYLPNRNYVISIVEGSPNLRESFTLIKETVPYGHKFLLCGSIYKHKKPGLFVKIIHTCTSTNRQFYKLFLQDIDQKFIKGVKRNKFKLREPYILGKVELSNYPSVYLSRYINRRASQ
uniref:LAGLIDADG_2 domain-containing protein n=1 Tax=Strongyloides venezuelensis TaxID=75913 RepID=A0A0K0EYH5_STRVS